MLVVIPEVLTSLEVREICDGLRPEDFLDGRATAAGAAGAVKQNLQTDRRSERLGKLQAVVTSALNRNSLFKTVAAPLRIVPPRFNLYQEGMYYGDLVDNAIMGDADAPVRVDCSFTLFLSNPEDYAGGELVIKSSYGAATFKLPAGHLVVYPTYYYHEVTPVSRGARLACISWVQSLIRDPAKRDVVLDLALASDRILADRPNSLKEARGFLDRARKNLLRLWIDT